MPNGKRKASPKSGSSRKSKKQNPMEEETNAPAIPQTEAPASPPTEAPASPSQLLPRPMPRRKAEEEDEEDNSRFIGEPIPDDEARQRWPNHYRGKSAGEKRLKPEEDDFIEAKRHYSSAEVDNTVYNLGDEAHVKADEGNEHYICKIIEMFEAKDGSYHFTAQWYYRAKDTVIKDHAHLIDSKRVFFSEIKDANPLSCLVEKLHIAKLSLKVDISLRKAKMAECDYYCDMMYLLPYSSFINLPLEYIPDDVETGNESESTISSEVNADARVKIDYCEVSNDKVKKPTMSLLDLYAGCGAMSTGLCLGSNMFGVNLVNKWAVDINKFACESLKHNHPETEVRNEKAEDFLSLIKEWKNLCTKYSLIGNESSQKATDVPSVEIDDEDDEEDDDVGDAGDEEIFEVEEILDISYGDPKETGKRELHFKIRWKNYGPEYDTWEPSNGLDGCEERIKEFVTKGYNTKRLPLPGDVDVVCGGPPCQGISGFNRFRNKENPLKDPKNEQLLVYMDTVNFLRPRFVLMENVVDIVKFAGGFLGRYALGSLVGMNYQARLGMMAAGCYGLPQFRMRVFMWGALPTEKLPQYPLPTHNVIVRGVIPTEFESSTVAYSEDGRIDLERELILEDAISDLPAVANDESRDVMPYGTEPNTEFQKFIRLRKDELLGSKSKLVPSEQDLYDHRPLQLNIDDYQRVCRIPKRKGASFRDLPGVMVRDKKVEWDPEVLREYLPSGKPLVPDYAMTFINGTSSKPFSRLWWDSTVPTVVTRAEPHNQTIMHPEQDRVLTVRENARLQGFPDYYKLFGPIKERYTQVGNAVAVPVSRALGYGLAMASQGSSGEEPLFTLPNKFPNIEKPAIGEGFVLA